MAGKNIAPKAFNLISFAATMQLFFAQFG